jgi:hypothetical protein
MAAAVISSLAAATASPLTTIPGPMLTNRPSMSKKPGLGPWSRRRSAVGTSRNFSALLKIPRNFAYFGHLLVYLRKLSSNLNGLAEKLSYRLTEQAKQ